VAQERECLLDAVAELAQALDARGALAGDHRQDPAPAQPGERTRPGLRPLLRPLAASDGRARWAWSHTGPGGTGGALRLERSSPFGSRPVVATCVIRNERPLSGILIL
jgi:hypothetical protein